VMALYERRASGRGQQVDASLLQTGLNLASGALIEESVLKLDRQSTGNRSPNAGPSDIFRVSDGWIIVQVIGQSLFKRWARLIGKSELLDDDRFRDDNSRGVNGEDLSEMMAAWCAGRTRACALRELEAARIPAGPVHSPRQALEDDMIRASGAFQWVEYPGVDGPLPIVASPVTLTRTPPVIDRAPPTIGQHTDQILQELGYDVAAIGGMRERGII